MLAVDGTTVAGVLVWFAFFVEVVIFDDGIVVVFVVVAVAVAGAAVVVIVAVANLLFVELFNSFALVDVELLLLFELIACVKLPLITFRGNGFGLITSTKERNKSNSKRNKNFKSNTCKLKYY